MTLSPEDVIKKSFSATHLRRGYDETQVDDFLDEVVVELRRLLAENESLRSDLEDCRASRGLGGGTAGEQAGEPHTLVTAPLAEDDVDGEDVAVEGVGAEPVGDGDHRVAELTAEVRELRTQLASCQEGRAELEAQLRSTQEQLTQAQERAPQAAGQVQDAPEHESGEQDPTSIISLAQRLHDQHVAEGESTKAKLVGEAEAYRDRVTSEADQKSQELLRTGQETHDRLVTEGQERHDELVRTGQQTHDRLVTQGQETHDRLVAEGQEQHDDLVRTGQETRDRLVGEGESRSQELVGEAEQRRSSILQDLTTQQSSLSGRIEELRTQENDLRDRLRTFLTDQLAKVESGRG